MVGDGVAEEEGSVVGVVDEAVVGIKGVFDGMVFELGEVFF